MWIKNATLHLHVHAPYTCTRKVIAVLYTGVLRQPSLCHAPLFVVHGLAKIYIQPSNSTYFCVP